MNDKRYTNFQFIERFMRLVWSTHKILVELIIKSFFLATQVHKIINWVKVVPTQTSWPREQELACHGKAMSLTREPFFSQMMNELKWDPHWMMAQYMIIISLIIIMIMRSLFQFLARGAWSFSHKLTYLHTLTLLTFIVDWMMESIVKLLLLSEKKKRAPFSFSTENTNKFFLIFLIRVI